MNSEEHFERWALGEIKLSNVDHHVILTARNLLFSQNFSLISQLDGYLYQMIGAGATQVDQLFARLIETTPMTIRHCHLHMIRPLTA